MKLTSRPVRPSRAALEELKRAALDTSYVSMGSRRTASVHELYRYPARFSPGFARAAIEAFSSAGDLVLDPFSGGGTTLVEAILANRHCVASDISSLANFVAIAKTSVYSEKDLGHVESWGSSLENRLRLGTRYFDSLEDEVGELWASYCRNLTDDATWRLRRVLTLGLRSTVGLSDEAQRLARLVLLRSGQWALDMRQSLPSVPEFRVQTQRFAREAVSTVRQFGSAYRSAWPDESQRPTHRALAVGLPGLAHAVRDVEPADIVVTSPPYPGVYVLYHRWKVNGRRETPAPFWIAGSMDGAGLAHYTMSARSDTTGDLYFEQLERAFAELVTTLRPGAWIVQMVGFANKREQLPRYLEAMDRCGLTEKKFDAVATRSDGRLWRKVPGRRWFVAATAQAGTAPHTDSEVVLFHTVR